jgi:hypothetical protein
MNQPEGYVSKAKEFLVCKLFKTLFGFKQSPSTWYNKIDEYFLLQSLMRSHTYHYIYLL